MSGAWRVIKTIIGIGIVAGLASFFVNYYSFIFSRKVKGVIESIERVQVNVALLQQTSGTTIDPQLFSFAVAIKEPSGEIVTSSAEDRQWAVAQKGQCVQAVFYPYPPWNVMKSGTFYNARLDHLSECPK